MIVKVFPDGWYASALPGGKYAVNMPGRQGVETHLGFVPWKDAASEPLYLVATDINGWKFAGQGHHNGDLTVEYVDGAWRTIPVVAHGVWPVIYDSSGTAIIATAALGSSQGYRYRAEDGRLILGDATIAPANGHNLHEWTDLSHGGQTLVIGQRGTFNDEVQVWDGTVHRRLEIAGAHQCRVIRSERQGDDVAIACYRISGNNVIDAVCIWATVAELLALPEAVTAAVAPNVKSFEVAGTWVANATAPGNLAIGSLAYASPEHTCVIAEPKYIESISAERRLGLLVYLDKDDAAAIAFIQACIPIAAQCRVPMFIYDDRRVGRFELVKAACGDAPCVWMPQWYLGIGEDATAFARLMKASAETFGGHKFLPVIRAYTSLNNTGQVPFDAVPEAAVVSAMNALVNEGALNVAGFLGPLFFAFDRGDGIVNRPAIKAAVNVWMQIQTTVTNAAAWASTLFIPEVPPMSNVPDHSHVTRELFETGAFSLQSKTACGIFDDAAARALHAVDENWGHLIKREGQNQYPDWAPGAPGHAVDAVLYRSDAPGQGVAVDLIKAVPDDDETAPGEQPSLSWGEDIPRYNPSDWRSPGPQPASEIQRPELPFVTGMSAFDFCTLSLAEQNAWMDLHIQYKLPYLRIIHQSVFRTFRSLALGLVQLDYALELIAERGLGALVSLNCDTREYGMSRADVVANTIAGNAILVKHAHLFKPLHLLPDLGNELQNGNEQPFMMDPFFLKELDALVDPQFPLGWGPMFGTGIAAAATGGSWIPHHSDRGLSPAENGLIMAAAQAKWGKKVMDREPLGFAEPGTAGQRTWDPEYARQLGVAAKQHGLSIIYHTQAGLRANVAEFGPSHRAGAVALLEGLGGSVIVTPPPPPAEVDALITLRNRAITSAINIAYDTLLNRKPDPIGIEIYSQRLREGWTVPQMEDDIRASPEYKVVHGG